MVKYTNPAGEEIFIDAFAEGRHLTPDVLPLLFLHKTLTITKSL
jgi:hypothetical protein